MNIQVLAPLGAAAALALSGCAGNSQQAASAGDTASMATATTPERSCFRISDIRGQNVLDPDTVLFRTGVSRGEIFRLDMRSACLSTLNADPLVLIPTGGSNRVCDRMDLDVKVSTPIGASPCMIQSVTRLTPAEVAALPADQRP